MEQAHAGELRYLSETIAAAEEEIGRLRQQAEAMQENILAEKKEMQGETSNSIGNLWNSDAFEQLVELSQFATLISRDIDSYENMIREIEKLQNLVQSPYFARIDFRPCGENREAGEGSDGAPRRVYIGRATFMRDYRIFVYDWRAPISGMFYRFGLGAASYEAPAGTIRGTISLKRQYEIKDGELAFYFDAELEILDEYLRKMLSQNASPQMKSIVETIQREQDAAIRDVEHDVLAVQGVAGSGKTSIALHRIAYLMYNGLSRSLDSRNILILSPNAVFENYIANVLPELGEENVQSLLLDELLELVLGSARMQTRYQMLESLMLRGDAWVRAMKSSLEFKCSADFKRMLDALEGGALEGSALKGSIPSGAGVSPQEAMAAYRRLFADDGSFYRAARKAGATLPPGIAEILRFTRENLDSSTLFFDDASALAYLLLKQNGSDRFRHIRQVVVDEAQDYYPLHFEICRLLFPRAQYTLLGDVAQTVEKPETMAFYESVLRVFGKSKSALINLKKSFRCSSEIIRFSADILGTQIRSFGRQGERPALIRLRGEWDTAPLIREIKAAEAAGYQSIGILCKSEKECLRLRGALRSAPDGIAEVRVVADAADTALAGALLLPIYLSKGLEFDAVLLWGADSERYRTEADRSLLFIGCTRALHRLRLFYAGKPSALLGNAVGESDYSGK